MKVIIFENLSDSEEQFEKIPILIPQPQEILTFSKDQSFKIESVLNLAFYNVENESLFIKSLNDYFSSMAEIKLNKKSLEKINDLESKLPHENSESSYYFDISNNQVLIASEYERGLFYGLQTFIQIVKNYFIIQNQDGSSQNRLRKIVLPQITIRDFCDIKMRGVAYDCSRGQIFSVVSAKRFIRILSHYKLNTMCLYIEDTFAHPKHPLIGKNRGAFTPEEIREIDEYAKNHFIELIPIFECLGHVDNILQHKKYQDLGEFPGAHCLDISNPDVFPFLEDYISLMSETFSTKTFHIGCDESFDIGRHRSQGLIEKKGKGQALIDYYEKIYEITKKHGNERVIMYDDFVRKNEEVLEGLTRDITLMYWDYEPHDEYPAVKNLLDEGYKVIVSPSMLNWNRNFPDNKNASKNIIVLIDEAYTYKEEGCLGVLTSTWGDQRYFSLRENEIFGALLTAGKAWNCKNFDYKSFKRNFGYLFYGIKEKDLDIFQNLFTKLSSTPEYYYRLLVIVPPIFYTDLFKHPFTSKKVKPAIKEYEDLKEIGVLCLDLYKQIKDSVLFEKKNFEYIKYGAELATFCGRKIKNSVDVSKKLRKADVPREELENIIKYLSSLKEKVGYLKDRYEDLWLRASKRPCLDYNLQFFDHLMSCYEDKISQLKENITFKDPQIPSEWIWANETICPAKPRYFRKSFKLDQSVEKAILQAMVCNHMEIYINGKFIGEVLGRFSLSRLPIILRVQTFDITPYLEEGRNNISVKAFNYDGYKGAINIFAQIRLESGEIKELNSDSSWVCSKKELSENDEWNKRDYNDKAWKKVKSYGSPPKLNGDILKPNLLEGEKSLTQAYFDVQGYFYNGLISLKNKYLVKYIIRPFIPLLIKILKPFG
jgi:hypothetical protein